MAGQKRQRLKSVLDAVPPGFLVDARWLKANGVGRTSAHDYDREGWLERVGHGVYRRPFPRADAEDARDWNVPILSAQWIMGYDFHVGGASALNLEGHEHYLPLGNNSDVYLHGRVPSWLPKLSLDARFRLRKRSQLFVSTMLGIDNLDFDPDAPNAPSPWNWPLRRSSSERAVLENLNELPDKDSFHRIDVVFQGLANLRPGRLNALLKDCKSVKVKRLFFLFADRHQHKWLSHIDRSQIDLGTGPRALVEDGRYAADYLLMVPPEFARSARGDENGA